VAHFDLVVIGTGSGNSIVNRHFDDWRVAIIEEHTFGGTCINVGCIPTKMFVYPAELAGAPAEAARLGVDIRFDRARWPEIRDRIFGRIDHIVADARDFRVHRNPNVTVYEQHVRFTGPRELRTDDGQTITADHVVVATGSRPLLLDVPGGGPDVVDHPGSRVHTSDTVMRIDDVPRHVVIVGGGYVAAEFAHVFSAFGSTVTQVVRSTAMLRNHDADISARYTAQAAKQWNVRLERYVDSIEQTGDGVNVRVRGDDSDDVESIAADVVLLAVGRAANVDGLDPAMAGLDRHRDGRLVADPYQRLLSGGRPASGMWTLGDVSSDYELKHVANHEARVVQHNLLHPDALDEADHRYVPSAVFTRPQVASVGRTEAEAVDAGYDVITTTQEYGSVAYGWAMEDETGFVKLVADRATGLLLGAHILGHEAAMIIQPLVQAMSFGLPPRAMARGQYWIHPALPEVVENALIAIDRAGRR
jgi:mycothione reductase